MKLSSHKLKNDYLYFWTEFAKPKKQKCFSQSVSYFYILHENYFSWREESLCSSLCLFQKRSHWSFEKKASKVLHSYIWYFKWHICIKTKDSGKLYNKSERVLQTGMVVIYLRCIQRVTFVKKKHLEENTQNYIQNLTHLSRARKLYKKIKLYKEVNSYTRKDYRNCWYKIGLNKTEEDFYWEVLLRRFLRGFLKLWRGRKLSQTTNRGNLWMKENIRWGGI